MTPWIRCTNLTVQRLVESILAPEACNKLAMAAFFHILAPALDIPLA